MTSFRLDHEGEKATGICASEQPSSQGNLPYQKKINSLALLL